MPEIQLDLDGDGAWPDLAKKPPGQVIELPESVPLRLAALKGGMRSGLASVYLRVDLPTGTTVLVQTSLRSLWTAVDGIAIRYGEPHMQRSASETLGRRRELALAALTQQLFAAQERLGETPHLDMSSADAAWEAEQGGTGGANS